jgi:legumain
MMQDDVANSPENPFKGKLYNKVGSDVDVYAGCKVDYRGSKVTKELFTQVLTGDAAAGGKVLKSGPNDRVFVNFVDHGGVGIIAFPNGSPMHATELSSTLKTMQQKKLFGELVFYMEACESGSMFPDLTSDGKIFAVTAANAKESSWGYYCPPTNDTASGKHLKTCLGDLFSIAWMEDADLGQMSTESLKTQVQRVTARTAKSHVTTFGDKSFESEVIGHFEVGAEAQKVAPVDPLELDGNAINTRDIHVEYYRMRAEMAESSAEREEAEKDLAKAVADRTADFEAFGSIARRACEGGNYGCDHYVMNSQEDLKNFACHAELVQTVHEACPVRGANSPGGWNSYNMRFSKMLKNACQLEGKIAKTQWELKKIVQEECAASSTTRKEDIVV